MTESAHSVMAQTLRSKWPVALFRSEAPLALHHLNLPLFRALSKRFPELQQELATMLIPKDDRKKIHEYLFREGVLVAKKDYNLPKHGDIDTKNLYVIKALQSLDSRGFVKTQFSWQYYYYTLTPEGLDYLREWLHLPAEVVPATHIKQQRSHAPPAA
ncbi:hypothetical protein N7499_010444 [Penicillium canescens]|uniref:uncharacterized protein n=1 Tax=Penicillium canescens TaxID=5083 RepID=UPI0026DFBF17|nr:uncharacterized protein N7446_005710 [Penicillium canescens]KAJ5989915.1 hypothetical protein N7522_010122 [Penicillium canescens]KAJ6061590.1 hypothetical protein N7446_005710 [Penicillium canescens]KAJ6068557.1 hypothetical protein N7499_010444 [Penicillium canescens]